MDIKFMRAEEVAEVLEVSTSFAYKVIRQLNNELKAKGKPERGKPKPVPSDMVAAV